MDLCSTFPSMHTAAPPIIDVTSCGPHWYCETSSIKLQPSPVAPDSTPLWIFMTWMNENLHRHIVSEQHVSNDKTRPLWDPEVAPLDRTCWQSENFQLDLTFFPVNNWVCTLQIPYCMAQSLQRGQRPRLHCNLGSEADIFIFWKWGCRSLQREFQDNGPHADLFLNCVSEWFKKTFCIHHLFRMLRFLLNTHIIYDWSRPVVGVM